MSDTTTVARASVAFDRMLAATVGGRSPARRADSLALASTAAGSVTTARICATASRGVSGVNAGGPAPPTASTAGNAPSANIDRGAFSFRSSDITVDGRASVNGSRRFVAATAGRVSAAATSRRTSAVAVGIDGFQAATCRD
jgi:hypothetical protein